MSFLISPSLLIFDTGNELLAFPELTNRLHNLQIIYNGDPEAKSIADFW